MDSPLPDDDVQMDELWVDAVDQYLSSAEWTGHVRRYVDTNCGVFSTHHEPGASHCPEFDHGAHDCFKEFR